MCVGTLGRGLGVLLVAILLCALYLTYRTKFTVTVLPGHANARNPTQDHMDIRKLNNDAGVAIGHSDWMLRLPDECPVSMVTIPGTHDTMARYGGSLLQCQTWPLKRQLLAGIRFLDIRCRHFRDSLPIHHGPAYQNATFNDVLREVVTFLKHQGSEFILMRIQEEYLPEDNTEEFSTAIKRYIEMYPREHFWLHRRWPTVGEARGRVVILQNFQGPTMGVLYKSMDIEDVFNLPTADDLVLKWRVVQEQLEKAKTGGRNVTFLTHTSGTSQQYHPHVVAAFINAKLEKYLRQYSPVVRWGILAMDFPTPTLIKGLIAANFDS